MQENSKSITRGKLLSLLDNQDKEERLNKSRIIQGKLFAAPEFVRARMVLFYASFDGEVETFEMMKQAQKLGKKIVLPVIIKDKKQIIPSLAGDLEKEIEPGPYGIRQPKEHRPVALNDIDLAIVPGVAFDRHNNRLGRGGGYYDRFLASLPKETPTLGLAFDFQILESLPFCQEHDRAVSRVLVN